MKTYAQALTPRRRSISIRWVVALTVVVAGFAAGAQPAAAAFGVSAFDGQVTADAAGAPYTQGGGHPYAISTTIVFNQATDSHGNTVPDGANARSLTADLPPGLVGNPNATPLCETFLEDLISPTCPASTQVGVARVTYSAGGANTFSAPIFSLKPAPGSPATFAFAVVGVPVILNAALRSDGDYGLSVKADNISQGLALLDTSLTFWGVPADPAHDNERGYFGKTPISCAQALATGGALPCFNSSDAEVKAFVRNPTRCTPSNSGLITSLTAVAWGEPAATDTVSFISHNPPGFPLPPAQWGSDQGPTGCDRLPFSPSIDVTPDTSTADSPTGLSVSLEFPQEGLENPTGLGSADLRQATVTLPDGMTISPSAADGLQACTNEQIGFSSKAPAACPQASKIGSAEATTPLLDDALTGGIYVGSQQSDDPQSGQMFRIFLVLENEARGLRVKLEGNIRANPQTGQLEATFANNPQLPVSTIDLRFKTGPRASLATPGECGTKGLNPVLASWGGQSNVLSTSFSVACPGIGGFAPSLTAGTIDPRAGAFSPFVLRLDRADRQEYVDGLNLEFPKGLVANLRHVALCRDAEAAAGTCSLESRIGTATVGAGPGSNPFFLTGSVSLTEGYKGAPYGLSVAVRALAGPFDLGTVVVRQAIFVDPEDAHLTIQSDPLPTIVKGVPLRLRSVNVDVSRPGFTLNPTGCGAKQIQGALHSQQGSTSKISIKFRASECRELSLKPKLKLSFTGGSQTAEGEHPGLDATLTQGAGQSNLSRVAVKLPLSVALDAVRSADPKLLCGYDESLKADPSCPKSSIIGSATAATPVLKRALSGPVYFVQGIRFSKTGRRIRTLPTLLLKLRGEVALNVRARSEVSKGKLVNTFESVPDAPVSKFRLKINGGKRGILVLNENLCRGKSQVALSSILGHSGAKVDDRISIGTPCS